MEYVFCLDRKLPKDIQTANEALNRSAAVCDEEYGAMFPDDYDRDQVEIQLYWDWKDRRWSFLSKYGPVVDADDEDEPASYEPSATRTVGLDVPVVPVPRAPHMASAADLTN